MKISIRKKTGFVLTLLACCVVGVHAKDVPECLRDLHSLSGVTNYNAETYLENIQQNWTTWVWHRSHATMTIDNDELRDWYIELANAFAPDNTNEDTEGLWRTVKSEILNAFSRIGNIANDTNCWLAVARNIGEVRSCLHTQEYWDEFEGIDPALTIIDPATGVKFCCNTNKPEVASRLSEIAFREQRWEYILGAHADNMEDVFQKFTASQTFKNLSPAEHNAISSNIVELAKMKPCNAKEYGLTNVVNAVSTDSGKQRR